MLFAQNCSTNVSRSSRNIVHRMIAGAGWYVKNDVIARDLRVETIEEFVRMLARRTFNRADARPYPSLHNLAPHYDRPTKGYQLPQDLVSKSPNEEKVLTPAPAPAAGCRRLATTTTPTHMNIKLHGQVSLIKMYATHMCNGCIIYKMQLDWSIRHSCTPTVTYEAWLKYRSFNRLKTLSIICPPHRKKSVLRSL
ncbi:hypothetical protein EVAR_11418_1 [Eumeta japonica]|uniref:Uncharacterized protein n=1 Tax=Eumeta variegata TaxID=151549 RepID=A0A4C1TLM7_EUMVA|nr:hypothetical protein EVAR_11418_1 [Eumeta japonica]